MAVDVFRNIVSTIAVMEMVGMFVFPASQPGAWQPGHDRGVVPGGDDRRGWRATGIVRPAAGSCERLPNQSFYPTQK